MFYTCKVTAWRSMGLKIVKKKYWLPFSPKLHKLHFHFLICFAPSILKTLLVFVQNSFWSQSHYLYFTRKVTDALHAVWIHVCTQNHSKSAEIRIHQPFSRIFIVVFSKIFKLECNRTSHRLNHMISQSEVVLHSFASKYRKIWLYIYQPFSRAFFVCGSCQFESNTTSDWLNRMFLPIRNCVTFK